MTYNSRLRVGSWRYDFVLNNGLFELKIRRVFSPKNSKIILTKILKLEKNLHQFVKECNIKCNITCFSYYFSNVWDNFVETFKNPRPINIIILVVAILIISVLISMLLSIVGYFFCGCSRICCCCGERKYTIVNHWTH